MSTPAGTRCRKITLVDGCIHVYSNREQLVLQIRRSIPTEEDLLSPSFKVAVALRPHEALDLASELLAVASAHCNPSHKETAAST